MTKLPIERLDTSRPHGFVSGETAHNIAYEQNGYPYDAHGDLIEAALDAGQTQILFDKRARAAAKLAAQQAKGNGDEAAAATAEGEDAGQDDDDKKPAEGEDEINLLMFLKGEARYKPHEIQAALKKRYGVNKPRPRDAAIYLVEEQRLLAWPEVAAALRPQQQQ